eukprot:1803937-Prymnesium_polylepis.1
MRAVPSSQAAGCSNHNYAALALAQAPQRRRAARRALVSSCRHEQAAACSAEEQRRFRYYTTRPQTDLPALGAVFRTHSLLLLARPRRGKRLGSHQT